jgi:molybdopterin converting factor small subunit
MKWKSNKIKQWLMKLRKKINKRTKNNRNYNHKNNERIQQKKKELKSNDNGLNWKINSN